MSSAVYPGSFDPVTNGHFDIIKRASQIFDNVVVLVMDNKNKKGFFSINQRLEMLKIVTNHIDNVSVDFYSGLLVDYMKLSKMRLIVKGLRTSKDFEYEESMFLANRSLYSDIETVFFASHSTNRHISSSLVKEVLSFNGDISNFVPKHVNSFIKYGFLDKE